MERKSKEELKSKYYSLHGAAKLLDCTPHILSKYLDKGFVTPEKVVKQDGKTYFPKSVINKYGNFWHKIRTEYYTHKEALEVLGFNRARLKEYIVSGEIKNWLEVSADGQYSKKYFQREEIDNILKKFKFLEENYYTVAEASKLMNRSKQVIRIMCGQRYILPYVKFKRSIYIEKKFVEKYEITDKNIDTRYISVEDTAKMMDCRVYLVEKAWRLKYIQRPIRYKGIQYLFRDEANALAAVYNDIEGKCFCQKQVSVILNPYKSIVDDLVEENLLRPYAIKDYRKYFIREDVLNLLDRMTGNNRKKQIAQAEQKREADRMKEISTDESEQGVLNYVT